MTAIHENCWQDTARIGVQVCRSHKRSDNLLSDICDGNLFETHELYSRDANALQLIMYFDEVEPCNALGAQADSQAMHVLLHAWQYTSRSTHRAIQLIACVTTPNLNKYGFQDVLRPFIEDVNLLREEGITVKVNGMEHTFYGSVIVTLCDTLAAHQLGGFKVGVGFSLRKCRDCMATRSDIQEKFVESEFQLRDPTAKHCDYLEGELGDYDSVTYGINYKSPLNGIHGFHVANNQLPQHILLEGTLPLELKLMLSSFTREKNYFTIEFLNDRVSMFDYSSSEARNKPPKPFKTFATDGSKLHLSAAQTWSFATFLPLLIGDKVPEEDSMWLCFLDLLEIVKYCTARVTSDSASQYMCALVESHHQQYKKCYPAQSFIPKSHYMVHFPRLMLRVGPLISCWCMRMEAKTQIGNFKMYPYLFAKDINICFHGAHLQRPRFFTYDELECGPSCTRSTSNVSNQPPDVLEIWTGDGHFDCIKFSIAGC